MFDWLFEKEVEGVIRINTTDYFDWIDKIVEIFHAINKHDVLKNRIAYAVNGLGRSGLADQYMIKYDYVDGYDEQVMTIRCWEGAWKELEKLPWVTIIAKAL